MKIAIENKLPDMLSEGVALLHDNAHTRAVYVTTDVLEKFGWEVLQHLSCSPNIFPVFTMYLVP